MKKLCVVVGLLVLASAPRPAGASVVTFSGLDDLATAGGPRPISDAAAAAFASSLATSTLVDFESFAVGFYGALVLAPGANLTIANTSSPGCGGICDQDSSALGFNTTAGGDLYLRTIPLGNLTPTLTFTFDSPIDGFGGYFTGTETTIDGTFSLTFNDGSVVVLAMPENGGGGGVQFFGFTDAGKSISSITLTETGPFNSADFWGLDDLMFGNTAAVPEPSFVLLLGAGLCGLAALQRRRART